MKLHANKYASFILISFFINEHYVTQGSFFFLIIFIFTIIFAGLMFGEIANRFSGTESYLLLTDEELLLHHVSAIYLQLLQDDMQI